MNPPSLSLPASGSPAGGTAGAVTAVAAALFIAATAWTVYCARTMSGGMPMPGGWEMSMMWMPMPGQGLAGAAAMFLGMWTAMMIAMMLPSAMPMILVYRRVTKFHAMPRATLRLALLVIGYFGVWAVLGAPVFFAGLWLAHAAMAATVLGRAIPLLGAAALVLAGAYQWTRWKSSCLRHCRDPLSLVAGHLHDGAIGALRLGVHHGAFCAACCWSLMTIQVVLGMMNLWVMALIALVIALEKMLPRGMAVARVAGAIAVATGLAQLAVGLRHVASWH